MTDTNVVTTTAPGTSPKPPIVVLRERLEARKGELRSALTDINPDHFIRALITSAQVNPDLQACSFQSLWLACMRACRDNLLPDGREGAIVPFKSNAQWVPMYQGLLKRFRQSGQCKWITADVVRQGETFEHWVDQCGEHFKHVPSEGLAIAPVERVYAAALTKDGAFYVAVLSMAEITKIKNMSRGSRDDAPWKVWFEEMAKKTALRRLSKLLPAGRDIFEEDEAIQPETSPGSSPLIQIVERPAGAAGALNQFAGTGEPATPPPAESGPEAAGEAQGEAAPNPPRPAPTADKQSAVEAGGPVEVAYKRGAAWRTTGGERKAMPPEYRDLKHSREALAWGAGFDGKPIPTFSEQVD